MLERRLAAVAVDIAWSCFDAAVEPDGGDVVLQPDLGVLQTVQFGFSDGSLNPLGIRFCLMDLLKHLAP